MATPKPSKYSLRAQPFPPVLHCSFLDERFAPSQLYQTDADESFHVYHGHKNLLLNENMVYVLLI